MPILEENIDHLDWLLENILLVCLTLDYVSTSWQKVRVVKPKSAYLNLEKFRQINLTSFSPKCLKGLLDSYIREKSLRSHPLKQNEHAYQRGKSCESAFLGF